MRSRVFRCTCYLVRAELVAITIGSDYGNEVEVVPGVSADDTVILDPADSLVTGTPVQIREPPPIAQ